MEFNAHVPRELCETATPLINWKIWDIQELDGPTLKTGLLP